MRSSSSPSRGGLAALLWLGALAAAAQEGRSYAPYPEPDSGYVTDLGEVLSAEEEERIEQWLWQVESRTQVELIVVTIGSMSAHPGADTGSIEAFARGLFDAYGVGNLPQNDGVLLLVSVSDRKARIELGAGHGASGDEAARAIMEDVIVPAFKDGDFAGGITGGVRALAGEFAGVRIGFPWTVVALFAGAIALGIIGVSLLLNGKRGWGWVVLGLAIVVLLAAVMVLVTIIRHMSRSRSGSWGAGGAGGFGGGFSGGGGATGSW